MGSVSVAVSESANKAAADGAVGSFSKVGRVASRTSTFHANIGVLYRFLELTALCLSNRHPSAITSQTPLTVPSAMKQPAPFGSTSSNSPMTTPLSVQPSTEPKKVELPLTLKKDATEGTTKPPYQITPASQSMQIQGTPQSSQPPQGAPSLPTASSWDGLNGRDPASPAALPKDFVFAQPLALPPRDGPKK